MSAVVLKPCCICRQIATKKLSRGKSNCKDICGSAIAHRECLDQYCVFCAQYIQDNFKTCLSCSSKIHDACERKESRRPEARRLGHRWTSNVTNSTKTDPVDFDAVEDVISSFAGWADEIEKGGITKSVGIGAFGTTTKKK